ncbi:MAG TPA: YggU family protein [Desulfuromonadales bacterium]|nr:YggU family protein [Desulfuromonadales bacterium]
MSRSDYPFLTINEHGLFLNVFVQPRASKNQVCGIQGDELKIRLTSPPVDGAANRLCREFVAKLLGVSRASVEIVSGESSRHKRIRVESGNPLQLVTSASPIFSSSAESAGTKGHHR